MASAHICHSISIASSIYILSWELDTAPGNISVSFHQLMQRKPLATDCDFLFLKEMLILGLYFNITIYLCESMRRNGQLCFGNCSRVGHRKLDFKIITFFWLGIFECVP